jgi:drug/metabolite transporter (DMT)-like permease
MAGSKSLFTYILLFVVVVIWAIAWPVSKIGLIDMPPMWYTLMRLCVGFVVLFLILLFQGKIIFPKKRDLPFVLSIGLLQMASFLLLLNGGLLFVDAGRSAILVYSTPFLVTPIAIWFFGEHITPAKLVGLVLGLLGILILFSPWSFNWSNSHVVVGNLLLLLAAACWAITMLHTRYGTWHTPSLLLVPWQLLIACILVSMAVFIVEPHPHINWSNRLLLTILYNGVLSTGLAYPIILTVSRRLPVTTTSLLMLGVPVLGLICSAWWLDEKLTAPTLLAMCLIITGLVAIALDRTEKISYD